MVLRVISYSIRAASAMAYLKRPYNDVDIFVEDTGNHSMWLFICVLFFHQVKGSQASTYSEAEAR